MRLFLAADLPDELREALARARERLERDATGWRWLRPEAVHLTLRFLGDVDEGRDLGARGGWRNAAAAAAPIELTLGAAGCFPAHGAPRVLWIGVRERATGGALEGLAAALERMAREAGWAPESRPFRPHLTLARRARGARPQRPPGGPADEAPAGLVERLVLYRSHLDPGGARYTALDSYPLGLPPGVS